MLVGTEVQNKLTGQIIGSAIKVHTRLGPGLLEHSYARCLRHELEKAGLKVEAEVFLDLKYEDLTIERAYRLDLLVEDSVVLEVKAVEKLMPVHHSQVLTYLKLTGKPIGLLLNFNVPKLPDGIKRFRQDTSGFP
jgi:GxxExxY protein